MALQIYATGIGTSAAAPTTPTFAGIVQSEILSGGFVKVSWAAATGTITGYKIYLREANSTLFSDTYWIATVPSGVTSTIICLEPDNDTFLKPNTEYRIGVRALNETIEDANTAVTVDNYVSQNHIHFALPVESYNN